MQTKLQALATARWLRAVLFVLAMLVPFTSLIYAAVIIEKPLTDFVPNYWNDEVGYWRYVETFRTAGLNGGYHIFEERTPTWTFSRSDVHGPFYPMLMGTIARFTGWSFVTPIFINMMLISLAVGLTMWITRMSSLQIIAMMLLTATFWIIPLFSMGVSQEPLHQAFAIVLGGIFAYLLQKRSLGVVPTVIFLLVLTYMSFIRIQWALVVFPFWLLRTPRITLWTWLQATVLTVIFAGGAYYVFTMTASPGGSSITNAVTALREDFGRGVSGLVEVTVGNIRNVLERSGTTVLTAQLLVALVLLVTLFIVSFWRRVPPDETGETTSKFPRFQFGIQRANLTEFLFHLYNIGLVLALALVIYLPNGYSRVWGVCVLISLIVLIVQQRYRLLGVLFLINVLFFVSFVADYRQWQGDFLFDPAVIQAEREEMATLVDVNLNQSPWCNTVLFDVTLYDYRALLFPSEMGLAWYYPSEFPDLPIQSKYLYTHYEFPPELNVELIAEKPFGGSGNLYRNLDAACP